MSLHPCLSCGACCAFFRVSFHWSETLAESHGVPSVMTNEMSLNRNVMKGTDQANPRCIAFTGEVGSVVGCSIYLKRPGCCRDFKASFENATRNAACDEARLAKGMKILSHADFVAI